MSTNLSQVQVKEMHGVRSKLGHGKNPYIDDIAIVFSFIDKKDQTVERVEVWKFNCRR
jgi:hypothetical protein